MPQRRNYYGGGYYDQSSENYDPYSKWGNVGLTIRNTIAKIVAKRKEEQERAKQEAKEKWVMEQEERKTAAEELRAKAYAEGIVNKPSVEPKPTTFDKKKTILDGLLERGEISQEQYNYAVADIPMKVVPKTTITKQPSVSKPRISETPQYRQTKYINGILSKLDAERSRLKTAGTKLDPKTPEGKDVRWRANNLDMAIGKLRHQLGLIALGEPLPESEFTKSVAIGSDMEKNETQGEHWGTMNVQPPPIQQTPKDEYGFTIGETRGSPKGLVEYVGNNQWRLKK